MPDSARSMLSNSAMTTPFLPIKLLDGYLPIEDHGLIGDGTTAALVGRNGEIDWLCVPRFDGKPLFSSILDSERGGSFTVDVGRVIGARHRYLGGTSILITELRTENGVVRITDLMPLKDQANLGIESEASTGELLRCIELIEGDALVKVGLNLRQEVDVHRQPGGYRLHVKSHPTVAIDLECSRELDGLQGSWSLRKGESVTLCLRWNGGTGASSVDAPVAAVTNTIEAWTSWLSTFNYRGPQEALVRRSAITIKLLDYLPNGSLIAAPTSSLPELIGGERNWDYRYIWIRDASFAVNALSKIGAQAEAMQFLEWVIGMCRDNLVHVMYTLDGDHVIPELNDESLRGYRGSSPVRWGNGASGQIQHDVYGELVDCAYQWTLRGGDLNSELWSTLRGFVERAAEIWNTPDQGIWEVRSAGLTQTYSAGMCQIALDRGSRLACNFGAGKESRRWQQLATEIQDKILDQAWTEEGQYLRQGLGNGHLDAAALGLSIRRALPPNHPRMLKTVQAIDEQLSAGDGLLYRYLQSMTNDGLPGDEGAFVLCSFWMIENLVLQGRLDEAMARYDGMCARTNALGLLAEQIDPGTGRFLGNFPQAFSHLGLITSGVAIANAQGRTERGD